MYLPKDFIKGISIKGIAIKGILIKGIYQRHFLRALKTELTGMERFLGSPCQIFSKA
jgi:hypothetical protein